MNHLGFREKLTKRQENTGSIICAGLDPNMCNIPHEFLAGSNELENLESWMRSYIDVVAERGVSMFKPQLEHWESIQGGFFVLKKVIKYIREKYPDIVIFGDTNPGAIEGVDGMNFDYSIGERHCNKLLEVYGKDVGLVSACRRNNRDSWKESDIILGNSEMTWYQMRANNVLKWSEENEYSNAGLLLGSAHPQDDFKELNKYATDNPSLKFYTTIGYDKPYTGHIESVRKIVGNKLWLLIPGIGFSATDEQEQQEAIIKETIRTGFMGYGSMVINSSNGLSEAHKKPQNQGKSYQQAVEYEANIITNIASGTIGGLNK